VPASPMPISLAGYVLLYRIPRAFLARHNPLAIIPGLRRTLSAHQRHGGLLHRRSPSRCVVACASRNYFRVRSLAIDAMYGRIGFPEIKFLTWRTVDRDWTGPLPVLRPPSAFPRPFLFVASANASTERFSGRINLGLRMHAVMGGHESPLNRLPLRLLSGLALARRACRRYHTERRCSARFIRICSLPPESTTSPSALL